MEIGGVLQSAMPRGDVVENCSEFGCAYYGNYEDTEDKKNKRNFKAPQGEVSMENYMHKNFSVQSKRKIKWAVSMYCEWREARLNDQNVAKEIIRADLNKVVELNKGDLAYALARFIREIRRLDGKDYPPNTLKEIIIMIQMYLHERDVYWKLLDNPDFVALRNVVDNTMKERTAMGLGVKQSSDVISLQNEHKLFQVGALGEENPQQLLDTVIYMMGLHCALRGGVEHQRLRRPRFRSQIEFKKDENEVERMIYSEDPLHKTAQGGIGCKSSRKVVHVYPASDRSRCPVRLIKKYCGLLPNAKTCQKFYMRPRTKYNATVWFCDQPYGNHKVSKTIKEICKKGGLVGKFTNHSLRATSASRMFENEIPEQVIKEITGHKSDCVRTYKRTPDVIKKKASSTIKGQELSESRENVGNCKTKPDKESELAGDRNSTVLKSNVENRLEESLNACKMIKNVIKTRLEMRKRQGDKCKVVKRKVAQRLVKKQKRIKQRFVSNGKTNRFVIDVNLNVK